MRRDALDDGAADDHSIHHIAHDDVPLPREESSHSVFVDGGLSQRWVELGSGLFGHVPAGKYQDGGVARQDTRQGLGPLDAQMMVSVSMAEMVD